MMRLHPDQFHAERLELLGGGRWQVAALSR
jgi:hypothetical protein